MSLRSRCGKWSWRFAYGGREYSGATGLKATEKTRAAALLAEADARRLVEQGREAELKLEPKPFDEAVSQFAVWLEGEHREHPATTDRILASLKPAVAMFGHLPLHAITAGKIEDFKAARRAAGIGNGTLNCDLSALSRLFGYGRKHCWCFQNPVEDVDKPGPAPEIWHVVTAAEERAYFDACIRLDYRDLYDVGRLMLGQGLRPNEVLALETQDVDLVRGTLAVRSGKTTAARRTLRLTPLSLAILTHRLNPVQQNLYGPQGCASGEAGSDGDMLQGVTAHPQAAELSGISDLNTLISKQMQSRKSVKQIVLERLELSKHARYGTQQPTGSIGNSIAYRIFRSDLPKLEAQHLKLIRKMGFTFRLYDLRHTFATRAGEAGVSLPALAAIMGHSGLKTLPKYIHVRQAAMDEAMQQLFPAAAEEQSHAQVVH